MLRDPNPSHTREIRHPNPTSLHTPPHDPVKEKKIRSVSKMQDRLFEVGQSWMARDEKVDEFVFEKVGFSHQGTDRITSHQD